MLLLLIGGMQSGVRPAQTFEPGMDYWFIETLSVGRVELPVGVVVRTSDPAAQPRATLTLENQTQPLLFVMSLNYKDVLVMATPDPNWKARVNGAHEVASYLVTPDRPAYLNIEALTDLDKNLVDRNVLTIDPPPSDVPIPGAQSSELLLVYDEQVIEVPFTITYTFNPKFDNGTEADLNRMTNVQATNNASATATQQAVAFTERVVRNNKLIIGLAGVAALVGVGWLTWRGLSRRK